MKDVDSNTNIDTNDLNEFSELLTSSNKVLSDENLLELNSQQMLKTSQRQVAIEEEVVLKMEDVIMRDKPQH